MKAHCASIALLLTALGFSDEPEASKIDLEARKTSIVNLESQIKQRQERLIELANEITTLDARIEKRIAEQVSLLSNMRDSQDSRYKVSKMKREAIEKLHQGIETYSRKRGEMSEKIRQGDASALGDLDQFDKRALTRVDQIIEITRSFPTHRDLEKYESQGGSYWNGYYQENTSISEEWRQARRDEHQSDLQRDQTAERLQKAIERNEARHNSLMAQLEKQNLGDNERNLILHEIGQNDAIITHLKSQLQEVGAQSDKPSDQKPSLEEAIDIEHLLLDQRKNLRDDVSRLFRLYDLFVGERAKTSALQVNLEARKSWLQAHDPQ